MLDLKVKLSEKKKEYQKILDTVRENQAKMEQLNRENNSLLEKGLELQGQVKLLTEMTGENTEKKEEKSEKEAK